MKKFLLCILFLVYSNSFSQSETAIQTTQPGSAGISSEGINKINSLMQKYVSENKLPGIITLVARHGKVISFEKFGIMSEGRPMRYDAIFRIASMTKPITSVAVMILYEKGCFKLDDPVDKYIPQFRNLRVFEGTDNKGVIKTVKQIKPVTIRQLLMHTAGLASGAGNTPVDSIYKASDLSGGTLKDMINKLKNIPLLYQPGTHWNYGRSTDVLAYLVEVVSGKTFDVFLQDNIFRPLKMKETFFSVPADKMYRVASVYCPSDSGITAINTPEVNNLSAKVTFLSGNTGLISTIKDYMVFSQMLLSKGAYNGVRILKPETIELMTANQITNEIMPDDDYFRPLMSGMGFGLGFAVVKTGSNSAFTGSAGSYWWSGTANTYFFIDPVKDFYILFMTQYVPNFQYPVCKEFRELVYNSLID